MAGIDWRRDLMLWHPRLFHVIPEEPSRGHGFETVRRLRRWRGRADVYYARYDRQTDTLTEVPQPSLGRGE
jgi:hypothetical protein